MKKGRRAKKEEEERMTLEERLSADGGDKFLAHCFDCGKTVKIDMEDFIRNEKYYKHGFMCDECGRKFADIMRMAEEKHNEKV